MTANPRNPSTPGQAHTAVLAPPTDQTMLPCSQQNQAWHLHGRWSINVIEPSS
jgi:hypothetical protein